MYSNGPTFLLRTNENLFKFMSLVIKVFCISLFCYYSFYFSLSLLQVICHICNFLFINSIESLTSFLPSAFNLEFLGFGINIKNFGNMIFKLYGELHNGLAQDRDSRRFVNMSLSSLFNNKSKVFFLAFLLFSSFLALSHKSSISFFQ